MLSWYRTLKAIGGDRHLFSLTVLETKIVTYLLTQGKTHYQELITLTGLSRMTVVKTLDHIGEQLQPYGIQLVRKKGDGLYLTGDTDQLLQMGQQGQTSELKRVDALTVLLLLQTTPLTIKSLAETFYLSRNALQGDLKQVRQQLLTQQLLLKTTHRGLVVNGMESQKQIALAAILQAYWQGFTPPATPTIFKLAAPQLFDHSYLQQLMQMTQLFLKTYRLNYTDYQLKTLVITLAVMAQRLQVHQVLPAPTKVKSLLPVTRVWLTMVQEQLDLALPVAEQQLLDQQLQALQWQSRTGTSEQSQQILERFLRMTLAPEAIDHMLIQELARHLGETLERLKRGIVIHNPETETIKKQFPFSFERAVQLASQLCDQYQLMMSDDEIAYVALHFQSFLERQTEHHKISVVVVCGGGIGWMRLLRQRLMARYESQITIQRVLSFSEFQRTAVTAALIITTVPLPQVTTKVVVVSALLDQLDQEKLQLALQQLTVVQDPAQPLLNLLDPTAIYWRSDLPDAPATIRFLGQQLIQRGLAKEDVLVSTLSREIFSSTVVRQTAMPAAQVNDVLQPSLSILIAPKGINWYGQMVQVVFFLALDHSAQSVLPEIYQGLAQLKTTAFIKQLVKCSDASSAYQLIKQQLATTLK